MFVDVITCRGNAEVVMNDRRDRDHPNHCDDMPKLCPSCCRDEHCFITDEEGVTCPCGELIEGGE